MNLRASWPEIASTPQQRDDDEQVIGSAPFSREERITISPLGNSSAAVRLEATSSSLFEPHESHTTPFPRVIQQLVTCPNDGILSSENAKALLHVLLGDSSEIAVSYRKRRTMWMDIQSPCRTSEITVRRGLQYAVILPEEHGMSKVWLSQLVPMSLFKKCPVADNNSQLITIANVQPKQSAEKRFLETAIDDWSLDSVLDLSAEQATPNTQLHGDRTLLRPRGVANSGRLVTRIATNGIECPTTVHVTEILPPYVLPLWDTWTLETRPLLSLQSDGTIVVEWTATLPSTDTDFQVMLDYEPVLLPFQQFPANPN